jgi:hypothetical protein
MVVVVVVMLNYFCYDSGVATYSKIAGALDV